MLRTIRISLALLSFMAIFFVFVDFSGWCADHFGFLTHVQLIPALLSLNVAAILVLAVLAALFGRLYCSVLCPLGVWQDIVGRVASWFTPRRKRRAGRFRYSKAHTRLRLTVLAIFVVLLLVGLLGWIATSFAGLIDPYSIWGRVLGQFAVPVWQSGAVAAADSLADKGIYLFDYRPSRSLFSLVVTIVAGVEILIISIMAVCAGRAYCNSICPVGTFLGFFARFAIFRPIIDTSKCNSCGSCGRHCKASCIDTRAHAIDYSRCVDCMDCIGACSQSAISFGRVKRKANAESTEGRRQFMLAATAVAGAAAATAAEKLTDGGLAPLRQKDPWPDTTPLVPAGAVSVDHLRSHCTACQLCISACPGGVLRPSMSIDSFMQPVMRFTDSYCRPECTACGDVCPAGAIRPVDVVTKSSIKIGTAVVDASICISAADGQNCGNCSRKCPAGAIAMIVGDNGNLRPSVDPQVCIGCGACEYSCPVGTASMLSSDHAAIHVEGLRTHMII